MIELVTQSNVGLFNETSSGRNLIEGQHHVRYLALENSGWDALNLNHDKQIEKDKFDTPNTIYFIKRGSINGGPANDVQGVVRINPTTKPYMLQEDCFNGSMNPKLAEFIRYRDDLVQQPDVWEGSRIAFHPAVPKPQRRAAIAELTLAKAEYIHDAQLQMLIGMMPEVYWNSVFRATGWSVMPFGEEVTFSDGSQAQAARYHITEQTFHERRALLNVTGSLLNREGDKPSGGGQRRRQERHFGR